ncbi:peptide ABC transporter permease [Plantibacter sp. Leaf171]|nr:peptide ABC transporter permease [Plantibacter sp. Leaf1]KQQ51674.1 peptide ABC transporter permease [Plantibacter sp. Leaf314]KQR58726.1 peptide ABC transporter permease [Plantibacter sp. Leaf171]
MSSHDQEPQMKRSSTHFVAPLEETPLAVIDAVKVDEKPSNLWTDAWAYMRRQPMFWISAVLIVLVVVVSLLPGLFSQVDPRSCNLDNSLGDPSLAHPLGFTKQGCDIYSRVIFGANTSLAVGLIVTAIVCVLGISFGALSGFYGGWVDSVLSRIGDIFFSIPYILAAVVVMSALAAYRSVWTISLAVGLFVWPSVARVLRAEILRVKNADYVQASIALGVSRFRILVRHVLPNSIAPVIVVITLSLASAIVAEATLSFLGVGLGSESISWGADISQAQRDLRTAPQVLIYPSIALSLTVLSFIMLGEVLRDALDPKARALR